MCKRRDHSCFQKCLFSHHQVFRETCSFRHFSLSSACKPLLTDTDVVTPAALSGWNPFSVSWILKICQKNQWPAGKMMTLCISRQETKIQCVSTLAQCTLWVSDYIFLCQGFCNAVSRPSVHLSILILRLAPGGWIASQSSLAQSRVPGHVCFFNETIKSLSIQISYGWIQVM